MRFEIGSIVERKAHASCFCSRIAKTRGHVTNSARRWIYRVPTIQPSCKINHMSSSLRMLKHVVMQNIDLTGVFKINRSQRWK